MSRQCSAHREIGRLLVADFAQHENLRVLAQQVPCRNRKR